MKTANKPIFIMNHKRPFSRDILMLDNVEAVVQEITSKLKDDVFQRLARKGGVVGISGGIDSSVCLALATKALGPDRVVGVMIPEKDSNPESEQLARKLAGKLGVEAITESITPALDGLRCYDRRDEAVKKIFSEYDPVS
jgi:NAD+ synthase